MRGSIGGAEIARPRRADCPPAAAARSELRPAAPARARGEVGGAAGVGARAVPGLAARPELHDSLLSAPSPARPPAHPLLPRASSPAPARRVLQPRQTPREREYCRPARASISVRVRAPAQLRGATRPEGGDLAGGAQGKPLNDGPSLRTKTRSEVGAGSAENRPEAGPCERPAPAEPASFPRARGAACCGPSAANES